MLLVAGVVEVKMPCPLPGVRRVGVLLLLVVVVVGGGGGGRGGG